MKKTFTTLMTLVFGVGIMFAYDGLPVKVGGIYYSLNISTQTAAVTYRGSLPTGANYSGDIVIPSTITYNDTIYNVTSIGSSAFKYCENLKSVVIPNSVTTIEDEAFFECKYLKSVTIPNSVITIKKRAFYYCVFALTSVTIPNSVTSIGEEAFYGCQSLVSVIIGNGVTNIGKKAFNCGVREVRLYATIPPTIANDLANMNAGNPTTFPSSVSIYIPCGTLETYMASNWQCYQNIQYNPSVFNIFNVDIISSDSLMGSVSSELEYDGNCNTLLNLAAIPNEGYKFVQWSDGNIETTRTIVLNTDISLVAEFDIAKSGTCGKNDQLSWIYDDKTKTLTISGSGGLTENCFFGLEAPKQMQTLIIGDGVTTIGDSVFYAISTIRHLSIGSGMTSIGNYAFAECKNFDDITCYATTVPSIKANTFANIGNKYYIYLYVPEDCQRAYKRDTYWSAFDIKPIVEATSVKTDDVKVTPSDSSAVIAWPSVSGAASYELVIKDKDGNVICTLVFNANGQLTSIAFNAPSRDHAPQQAQASGFSFTVTGLEGGTGYDLTITAKDGNGSTLDTRTVSFTTTGEQGIEELSSSTRGATQKIVENGQILILRGDKTYTLTGQEVR